MCKATAIPSAQVRRQICLGPKPIPFAPLQPSTFDTAEPGTESSLQFSALFTYPTLFHPTGHHKQFASPSQTYLVLPPAPHAPYCEKTSPGYLVKMQILIQEVLRRALKFGISGKLPGDADAAGLWTTLGIVRC